MKMVSAFPCNGIVLAAVTCTVLLTACSAPQPIPTTAASQIVNARGLVAQVGSGDQIIYRFKGGPDGEGWYAGLVAVGPTLYGTTPFGGTKDRGTVFSLDASHKKRTLYNFGESSEDGTLPNAGLAAIGDTLYGTTQNGGAGRSGTVFSITTDGKEQIIHSFQYGVGDGADPDSPLFANSGNLYGTTPLGGTNNLGTVFQINTSGSEKVLYSFKGGRDGGTPYGGVIAVGKSLYGTTFGGYESTGAFWGTVFSVSPSGSERTIHRFKGPPDGASPYAGLINVNGTLFGTTTQGGKAGFGTVFSITPNGKERVIHSFVSGTGDGHVPYGALVRLKKTLYGTTRFGGDDYCYDYCGTIYSVTASGAEHVLYKFSGNPDGANPIAGLINVNGSLYGTTQYGGYGYGTIFRVLP